MQKHTVISFAFRRMCFRRSYSKTINSLFYFRETVYLLELNSNLVTMLGAKISSLSVLNRITTHEKYLIDSERSPLQREEWLCDWILSALRF